MEERIVRKTGADFVPDKKNPWQLKDLSFAERMLIARVRHNRCVVRVNSGRGKLSTNAIVFSNPTVQVYNILPPSCDEMSEVLAFVFLGPSKPTDEEFVRTPMLAALDWLKLNHCDYADLHISPENLDALPEYGMPFGVDWKSTSGEDSTLTSEQVSVDNGGIDTEGTRSGKCTFAVHGLSGDEYGSASIRTLKLKTLDHLANNGQTLGFGHSTTPQSMFNNIQLYPQMFPWLFPYRLGGIGHPDPKNRISEAAHKRFLLMYHDKRFQIDLYFLKKHFSSVVDRLTQLDNALAAGKKFTPTTEAEKACFALLDDLDHVGNHIQGSLTSKKYMRNEIWSLTAFKVDNNHPLCLYYADHEIKFSPRIRSFFDFMTKSFIKNVLGVGTGTRGLFGETDAYYGTVEQQGRLTLHMHMLVWITSALSPQEIRDRISAPDAPFQSSLVDYLESTHVGQFLTGTMEQVRAKGIHNILEDDDVSGYPVGYSDPTQVLPVPPPEPCGCKWSGCGRCAAITTWRRHYVETVDDLMLRSNVHSCQSPGCTRSDGTCSARFPREVHLTTEVDTKDGSIKMKKLEPMINNITPAVTYVLGCNTDASSLKTYHVFQSVQNIFDRNTICLGGTPQGGKNAHLLIMQMIGSPMACLYLLVNKDHYTNLDFKVFWWKSYVNEVLKSWPSAYDDESVLKEDNDPNAHDLRPEDIEDGVEEERVVVAHGADGYVGITNMDDYVHRPAALNKMTLYDFFQISERKKRTPTQFKKFIESLDENPLDQSESDVDMEGQDNTELDMDEIELDRVSETTPEISSGPFMPSHPLYRTHYLIIDKRKLETTVPNFAGGALPRADQGDRDYYCCTMITLFKPPISPTNSAFSGRD
ncbi:hypothetical protein C8J57DRAFT_1438014 [Mycena rebaudengoi]|nr:hypothetical protein C8J57DRAFT_1438014 [Mycena rebaudengoi]